VQNITRISAKASVRADLRPGSGRGGQDAKGSLPNSEINRAIVRKLAIKLQGHVLFARYAQLPRLKIFDFRNLNVGAEHNVLEIFDDFEIAEAFKDDDVKQTIINDSVFKKREGPSVKAAISNENKRSFFHGSMLRFDEQLWRLPCRDVRCGDEIAQRTETAFEREAGLFYHLRVQSHPGKLHKIFLICARHIHQTNICVFDDFPAALEIVRGQAKLHRENIDTAHWEQAQCGTAAGDSIGYLADCSVAACSDDARKSLLDCTPRQRLRFAGM
jgi:hypothetical protein